MSHDTLHESKEYKGLLIEVHYDYDIDIGHAVGDDEPCAILSYEGYGRWNVIHDNLDNYPKGNILAMIAGARRNPELTSESLADELGYDLKTTGKRFAVDYGDGQWHYFKTDAARLAGMLKNEGWENIKVETFTGPSQGDYYYFVYDQKILDKYAGVKDAKPATESASDCVNGNVYGYIIKEADGGDLPASEHDSCWGFIGEPDYCMKEAESTADYIASERQKARDSAMAEKIAEERPDLAPQWESRA